MPSGNTAKLSLAMTKPSELNLTLPWPSVSEKKRMRCVTKDEVLTTESVLPGLRLSTNEPGNIAICLGVTDICIEPSSRQVP